MDRLQPATGGGVHVGLARPAPAGQPCRKPKPDQGANVVALGFAHGGDAALQLGHARVAQGLRNGQFFGATERYARRLFAVAQRAVDDSHPALTHDISLIRLA